MLFDTVDALENKLKESEDLLEKFSSNNLKSMLCIHTNISYKPDLIINDLSTSTSHASDSNDCKMDYPKITTSIKHNPNNMENQICIISTQIITFIEKYILNSQ
jgi:hypothetical protein